MKADTEGSERPAIVTQQQIAERCGVAKSTVARALAGNVDEVGAETIARIRKVAAELGYNPNHHHAARRLLNRRYGRSTPSCTSVLFLPPRFTHSAFFLRVFDGLLSESAARDFDVVTTCFDPHRDVRLPHTVQRGDVDGAILLAGPDFGPHLVKALRSEPGFGDRPIIALQQPVPGVGCSAILTDDWGGAYATMTHLLELGHRAVAHFFGEGLGSYLLDQRLAAYRQACRDFGVDPQRILQAVEWDLGLRWQWDRIADALLAWLRTRPEITAVLACTDQGALAAWQTLAAAGYRIPEQMSLVGFGDVDAVPGSPVSEERQLTTVHHPLTEVGREAARLLIGQAMGEVAGDRLVTLPTSLVVRRSTGPAPAR